MTLASNKLSHDTVAHTATWTFRKTYTMIHGTYLVMPWRRASLSLIKYIVALEEVLT